MKNLRVPKKGCTAMVLGVLLVTSCATPPPAPIPVAEAPKAEPRRELPEVFEGPYKSFPEDTFHDLLVAEFAMRRGQMDIALGNYLYQARKTRDLEVTATAARLAQFLGAETAIQESADFWLELAPNDPDANLMGASAAVRAGRYQEAMQRMRRVLENGGKANFTAIAAGSMGASQDVRDGLTLELEQLLIEHPDEPSIGTALALLLQKNAKPEESLARVRATLAQTPNDQHALMIETALLQAMGRNDEARERLAYAVKQHPRNTRLRAQWARLLIDTDKEAARDQFRILHRASPSDAQVALALGLLERELGNNGAARRALLVATEDADLADQAHLLLGLLAEQDNDWDQALIHYRKVQGKSAGAAIRRLVTLTKDQYGLEQAQALIQQIKRQQPNNELAITLIEADLLMDAKKYQAGYNLTSEALRSQPDNESLLYTRSLFSERLGNVSQLESDLRRILENDPDNASALNALGYSLANLTTRYDEARALVDKALALRPNDPAILDSVGWVAFKQGNLTEAREYLERAWAQAKDDEIAAHLGEVMWLQGDTSAALEVWGIAMKLKPDSEHVPKTKKRLGAQ